MPTPAAWFAIRVRAGGGPDLRNRLRSHGLGSGHAAEGADRKGFHSTRSVGSSGCRATRSAVYVRAPIPIEKPASQRRPLTARGSHKTMYVDLI